jgi:hypothetical protein
VVFHFHIGRQREVRGQDLISVVVYGRNDSHGYNLTKRVTLSLNSIAQVLTDPEDEIVFVDWNTHPSMPAFPITIGDCLTERCSNLLRIVRVSSNLHESITNGLTHLPVVEPVARNVGIRRASPLNQWILSTNTDVLLDVLDGSLSSIVSKLTGAYYASPRYELPEWIWESLPRADPQAAIGLARRYAGKSIPLNVVRSSPSNLFDAPGDFQLMRRESLESIGCFDETMIHGWHVDSNLALRMNQSFGQPYSLEEKVQVFHCNHTRQLTQYHESKWPSNDLHKYVGPSVPNHARSGISDWGLVGESIPEDCLANHRSRVQALTKHLDSFEPTAFRTALIDPVERTVGVPTSVSLPFLLDRPFANPGSSVLYLGGRQDMRSQISQSCELVGNYFMDALGSVRAEGNSQYITVIVDLVPPTEVNRRQAVNLEELCQEDKQVLRMTLETLSQFMVSKDWSQSQTQFLFINAEGNEFEPSLAPFFSLMPSQFYSRVRTGVPRFNFNKVNEGKDTEVSREVVQLPIRLQKTSKKRRAISQASRDFPRISSFLGPIKPAFGALITYIAKVEFSFRSHSRHNRTDPIRIILPPALQSLE